MSQKRNSFWFYLPLHLLILTIGLESCDQKKDESSQSVNTLRKDFVKLKYSGEFRFDSLLQKEFEIKLKETNNKLAHQKITELVIEWNLLKGNNQIAEKWLQEFNKSSKTKNSDHQKWFRSFLEANKGNEDEAIQLLGNVSNKDGADPTLILKSHWLLGSIYERKKMDSMAINHYEKAIEIGALEGEVDYYLESKYHIGNIFFVKSEITQSEKIYKEALDESIHYDISRLIPFGNYHLGKVAEQRNQDSLAIGYYNQSKDFILNELGDANHFMLNILNMKVESLGKSD